LNFEAVILAAGQGTRMKSRLPKVLHPLAGKPLVAYVMDVARKLGVVKLHTVVGHGAEKVQIQFEDNDDVLWVQQLEQLGTGHAVLQAMPGIDPQSQVIILYGDVPMLEESTLRALTSSCAQGSLALLTVELADPSGYGRIVRDEQGQVRSIVEEKDCTTAQRAISEVNTGILALAAADLNRWLPTLSSDNAQGEYYLTDLIAMAATEGYRIQTCQPRLQQEVEGINSRSQLAAMERWYQGQLAEQLMAAGASLCDPARIDIRGSLITGQDVNIDINLVVRGDVVLGDDVHIGPNCLLSNCRVGDGVEILANSVVEDAVIESQSTIGPFARLRPGTVLRKGAKIGNFVETKNTTVGAGSKVNHLSYVGDCLIGEESNIGAGTITCNYDGANKHKTTIGDRVFIGSNTSLVAPITVGTGATVGAGSTVVRNVDAEQLAVTRVKQQNIDGWQRPTKSAKPTSV
jgi:bifunctional UDP-N-acetylglucosamine pyrophosphorylase/glucosamine-1-phosphate N-acetyltransferase